MTVRWLCALSTRVVLTAAALVLFLSGGVRGERDVSQATLVRGGVLRMVSETPMSLDPAEADSVYESLPLNQIFNGLVSMDASLNVLPSLASTWTISRDGTIYTIKLRPGVWFHDGSLLTADDVVFTIRRLLAPKRQQSNIACSYLQILKGAKEYAAGTRSDLQGVAALDPLTVRISLTRPYFSFLQVLAMDGLKIVSRAQVERLGDEAFARAPAGTGAFKIASWSTERLKLVANPRYFGDRPYLRGVDIHFFSAEESDSGARRFEEGTIDALEVPPNLAHRFLHRRGVQIRRYQELSLTFLGMNTVDGPLENERLRQALAHALDTSALVQESPLFRRAATGILPPGLQAYSPNNKTLAHDPAAARRLLTEAGYPGGKGLRPIELYHAASRTAARRTAERIQADCGAVGIPIVIRAVAWSDLSSRVDRKQAPLFLLSWLADVPDPDSFLRTLFEEEGMNNYFGFRDGMVRELLLAGSSEMNPVVRSGTYRRAEQRILDLAPLVPLYHPVGNLALRTNVHGLDPGPLGLYAVDLAKVWISPGEPGAPEARSDGGSSPDVMPEAEPEGLEDARGRTNARGKAL